jgi:Ca2+-transporting ATPase
VVEALSTHPDQGLDEAEVRTRLDRYGPNELPTEPPPGTWAIVGGQLGNPMSVMLLIVAVASLIIGQIPTSLIVLALVTFNVVASSIQELRAQASVAALADLQVPSARVRRSGRVEQVPTTGLVPGDIVLLEAGDIVPADGRIYVSANLEVQEAALTGESTPVAKDPGTLPDQDTALGDRTSMVFQNTDVSRGTATVVVTDTGADTQVGQIAGLVTTTKRSRSPLQQELDGMTKVFGGIAWIAVGIIAIAGLQRGETAQTLLLLCVSTAISAIPEGLPTFVQSMLSSGARQLADSKAIVSSLADVETLGGTTVINSDKTGTLTMNAMTATTMLAGGDWFRITGGGYDKTGAVLHTAGGKSPDFTRLGLGLALCSDATVTDDGTVVGDPTEAALVVLAAKMGIDAEATRAAFPRLAEVPFDSSYKFMATFHARPAEQPTGPVQRGSHFVSVKGAPDVVLGRCDRALWHGEVRPIEEVREELTAANQQLSEKGLRVLSFAASELDDTTWPGAVQDPMSATRGLVFIALVGIIDPLRPESVDAVRIALAAGVDVRMITGDHTVTARAIADQLGLGPGVVTGAELTTMTDEEIIAALPELHVFGRVAPEDKLRLARLMQESGQVVAMTGDAVNDAAALKQADVGVAMGTGSEVSKQAAKIVLTDDNFSTLVHAIDLGRDIYRRISSYVRLQLTILSSVLQLMVLATIFNVNGGVALFPAMLLFSKFFIVITIVIGLLADVADPGAMTMPPRRPGTKIVNRVEILHWALVGFVVAVLALGLLEFGPDEPSTTDPSVSMTMAFALVSFTAANLGLVLRRDREPAWSSPMFPYLGWIITGWLVAWAGVELGMLQRILGTVSLSGREWLTVLALSLVAPLILGIDKYRRIRHLPAPAPPPRPLLPSQRRGTQES